MSITDDNRFYRPIIRLTTNENENENFWKWKATKSY